MTTLSASPRRVVLEMTIAILSSLVVGVLAALLVFSQSDPEQLRSTRLLPSALSLLVFCTFALFRLTRITESNAMVAAATLCGIALVAVTGSVMILLVGCRYDACINL